MGVELAQTLVVLGLVAAAAGYIALRVRRVIASARKSDGCGAGCGCDETH